MGAALSWLPLGSQRDTGSPDSEVLPGFVGTEVTGGAQRTLRAAGHGHCRALVGVCDLMVVLLKGNEPGGAPEPCLEQRAESKVRLVLGGFVAV